MIMKLKAYGEYPTAPLATTFVEYIRTQEEHIAQYYTQIQFLTVPHEIYEILKSTRKVNMATDGGAIQFKGSIGFVLADEEGNILLTCYGQPSGNSDNRTEKTTRKPQGSIGPRHVIQFQIKGRTITRDFKRTVREIIQLPSFRKNATANDSGGAITSSIS
jgi:hypothetical protein